MLDELKPYTLRSLAQQMGTHPFELMRLRVYGESDLSVLAVSFSQAERIRAFSGIETLCQRIPEPETGSLTGHRWVPPLLQILLAEQRIGERTARMDNLWRGLSEDDQEIVKNVIRVLVSEGILVTYAALSGVQIAIHPDRLKVLRGIISGEAIPEALAFLWKA